VSKSKKVAAPDLPRREQARSPRKPTLTLVIDESLRAKLDRHRDVNWSEVIRRELEKQLARLGR